MNDENQPQPTEPVVTQPQYQAPAPQMQSFAPPPARKKSRLLPIIVALLVLIMSSGAAYALLVYLPNKPENVFKKAVSNLAGGGNYTVTGRLDQGDGNAPDFNYELKTSGEDAFIRVDASTFVMSPSMEVLRTGGKTYINASNWLDKAGLAERYTNYGEKGIQEHLAEFAENSGLHANQGKWVQIDEWVFERTATADRSIPGSVEEAGVTIESFGDVENRDGQQIRPYKVNITRDGIIRLLDTLDSSSVLSGIFEDYNEQNGSSVSISADLDIDIKTKTIQRVTYDGRPFRDATLSLNLVAAENSFETPADALLASKSLRPGIVWSTFFNPEFQSGDSTTDCERIADIKGIKMALEIHKSLHGEYPGRMQIATNGENYLKERLTGADPEVFKDPNGKFIGMHGSQYAYVAYTAGDSELCGPNNGAKCEKYFVATTLDNGQEYKLTSE